MWKSEQERSDFYARLVTSEARSLAGELEQKSFQSPRPGQTQLAYSGPKSTKNAYWEVSKEGDTRPVASGHFHNDSYERLSSEVAESQFGFVRLEDTEGGKWFQEHNIWNSHLPDKDKDALGDLASRFYARSADGPVVAIVGDSTETSMFRREEWPNFLENEKVPTINGVPRETFQFMSRQGEDGLSRSYDALRETVPNPNRQYLSGQSRETTIERNRYSISKDNFDRAMNEAHAKAEAESPKAQEHALRERRDAHMAALETARRVEQSKALNDGKTTPNQLKGDQSQRRQSQSQELNRQTSNSVQLPARETASVSPTSNHTPTNNSGPSR